MGRDRCFVVAAAHCCFVSFVSVKCMLVQFEWTKWKCFELQLIEDIYLETALVSKINNTFMLYQILFFCFCVLLFFFFLADTR